MRVLLVAAANRTSGGGERHVADLLRLLPGYGVEAGLVCPPGGDLPELAVASGVPVYPAPLGGAPTPAALGALRRAIAAFRPDVVHAHGSRAASHTRLADPRAASRCVYTVHGIHVDRAGHALRRLVLLTAERTLRPRTAAFIAVCESDRARGARLGILDPSRTAVVHNGIALPDVPAPSGTAAFGREPQALAFREEAGAASDAPLVLAVGRLHEQKDHATLLRAWQTVAAQVPAARLAIVGSGPLAGVLEALAGSLGLRETVRFLPPRADLAPAYRAADAFVLPSRWEGLPYVVLEAMAWGLPVIATAVDGIPEAITHAEDGLLVPAQDAGSLAEAILEVLGDPARARSMGAAARETVARRFAVQAMAAATADVYRAVVDSGV